MNDLIFSICPVCKVEFSDGTFKWSHRKANGDRYTATPDEVYSKVCGIAQASGRDITGCINSQGQFNKDLTWIELDNFELNTFNELIN